MHSFFTPNIQGTNFTLSEEESAHAVRVLRLKQGDIILLLDGAGKSMQATITEAHPKRCLVMLIGIEQKENLSKATLHIAIAPTKNIDRFEWFVEKATEIGIQEITPIFSAQSERKNINLERIQKILVSAMKQSQRLYIPKLNEAISYTKFIENSASFSGQKFLAHCEENEKKNFSSELNKSQDCLVLIGPEGDFNSSEIEVALKNNFIPVSLGNARLRTETAGVYVVSLFNS